MKSYIYYLKGRGELNNLIKYILLLHMFFNLKKKSLVAMHIQTIMYFIYENISYTNRKKNICTVKTNTLSDNKKSFILLKLICLRR